MNTAEHVLVGAGYHNEGQPAVDWAAREAMARGVALHLVRAYDSAEVAQPWMPPTDRMIAADLRTEARHDLDAALDRIRAQWPSLQTQSSVVDAPPVETLVAPAPRRCRVAVVHAREEGSMKGEDLR